MDPVIANAPAAVLVTANRAIVYGTVSRWLLHDIRSPAQAVSLVAELVGEGDAPLDPDLRTTLRHSVRQLTLCVETMDRTLRPMPHAPAPGPVALSSVFEFLTRLDPGCRTAAEVDLSQALAEPLPAVSVVEDHLEHVLLVLLLNAMEAIGNRPDGLIALSAAARSDHVELTVDDNGPGIPPEIRGRLFEPYVTTKPPSARATGLGLAVARYLLQLSNGTLSYVSKPSPGARFVVRLPVWRAQGS